MPEPAKTRAAGAATARPTTPAQGASVAIVGGGLSGLTAALRLAERGFKITLYEEKERLGGNLASEEIDGVFHDVYPHMFCEWYANFWDLFENDLGLARDAHFESRMGVKLLARGSTEYRELKNASTLEGIAHNLGSGVLSAPDMFLVGFSMLDLASHPFNRQGGEEIDRLDVNGFIYSRGYATEKVASLQNYMLMVIWSIQSDLTAAASYQDFLRHSLTFPRPTPFAWLAKGNLYAEIIAPLERKLEALGCDIQKGRKVVGVELENGEPTLRLQPKPDGRGRRRRRPEAAPPADYVILATSAPALASLVMEGPPGRRVVDVLPQLSELQRFREVAIPVVDVYFNRVLPEIPKDQVGLTESSVDLTMLDISQLWTDDPNMEGRTALVLAASNGFALPSLDPLEQGHMMIQRLHDYLPVFEPGDHWGDPKADICWEKTHVRTNLNNKLFINDIGSWQWRPTSSHAQTPKLFLAGDFCKTDVDMATVEAAVESGLMAALALQAEDASRSGRMRGAPVTIDKHQVHSDTAFQAAKLALLPFAYAATAWSALTGDKRLGPLPKDAYEPSSYALLLPLAFTLDWWKTLYWLARSLAPGPDAGDPDDPDADADALLAAAARGTLGAAPSEALAKLTAKTLNAAGGALQALAARLPSRDEPPTKLAAALSAFSDQAWRTLHVAAAQLSAPVAGRRSYQRRWRVKP